MARGREAHAARQAAVQALGRELSRRARSSCELCGTGGPLAPWEVPPVGEEPDVDETVLLCASCRRAAEGERDPQALRFLETAVWSELPIAQVVAVRILEALADDGVDWARETADQLWLDEAIRARIDT